MGVVGWFIIVRREMMQLLLATGNLHKILELKAFLKSQFRGIDLYSLRDFPKYTAPEETEDTFEGNAKLKATHAAKEMGMLTLADDSGLVIPALGGEPGIRSAHYAGDEATEKENREKVIENLKELPEEEREGFFTCTLCLASPDKVIKVTEGIDEGKLLVEPRGRGGHMYDSIFIKHDYSRTYAELEEDVINRVSYRRKALDKMLLTLEATLTCAI